MSNESSQGEIDRLKMELKAERWKTRSMMHAHLAGSPLAVVIGVGSNLGMDDCPDPECTVCGAFACPTSEPLHFHHDGCPVCASEEPRS